MSYYDYQPPNKFGYKDQLPEGDAEKIIKGSEFDDEFNKISAESQALDQELQEYDGRLDAEIADRIAGDENLQNQIDTLVGGGDINIDIEDVEGLAEFIDQNYVSKTTAEDQQIVSKFTFTTEKLGDQHGPNRFVVDPATYTAQFLAGSDMIGSDSWNNWDIEIHGGLKLTSMGFPPFSMQYASFGMKRADDEYIAYTNLGENLGETDPRWVVKPKLEVEGDLSVGGSTEITGDITLNGGNIIIDGGSIVDPDGNPQTGGSGASVHIGEAPPDSPEEGQQWLETPADGDAKMWIWDGAVWLEQPSNATGGGGDPEWADVSGQFGEDYVYLGYGPPDRQSYSVSIGNATATYGDETVAIGFNVNARPQCVSIGFQANNLNDGPAVAIGWMAATKGASIALGRQAIANDKEFAISPDIDTVNFSSATVQATDFLDAEGNSIVGGGDPDWADVNEDDKYIYIGYGQAPMRSARNVSIGDSAFANGTQTVAVGYESNCQSGNAVAVGSNAETQSGVSVGHASFSEFGIAIGNTSLSHGNSIALGPNAEAFDKEFAISPLIEKVNFSNATVNADTVHAKGNVSGYSTELKGGQGIEQRAPAGVESSSAYRIFLDGSPTLQISNNGDYSAPNSDMRVNKATAGSFVKTGGTASQLLCADGTVVDKSSVGGSSYDGSDAVKLTGNQNISGRKAFTSYGDANNGLFLKTMGGLHSSVAVDSDISGAKFMYLNDVNTSGTKTGLVGIGYGSKKGVKEIYASGTVNAGTFRGAGAEVEALKVRGSFVLTIDDVMDSFKTLRDATKDEDSIEGLRTAISDSIGGLLQKLESMKADLENDFPEHSGIHPDEEPELVQYDQGEILQ